MSSLSHKDEASARDIDLGARSDEAPRLAPEVLEELEAEEDAHVGVKKVEAAEKVYGRYSKWFLFIGLGLASYIYSLDGSTTYSYLAFATSTFGGHSLISSIQVAQSIIVACGKPVIAKLADATSRATAYLAVLIFYVVGYIVIASAHNVGTIAGGIIIYAVGYTGLQLLTQVVIADITVLKWRGLVSALMSAPFIINGFIGSNISSAVIEHAGWRWGYGMFAILVPVSLSPLIITLFWAEHKAKVLGLVSLPEGAIEVVATRKVPLVEKIWRFTEQLDLVGLALLGAAVALILLPLTLSQTAKGGWNNGSMVAMLVVGVVLLGVFAVWDLRFASRPVIARRFLSNIAVVAAAWIGFFDFVSFYLTYTYLFSFVLVVKPWSLVNANYFASTQTVALTVFGILAGGLMRYLRRYKYLLVIGLCIRLLGVGLMIHSRGAEGSDAELVWTQILQGMGGGFAAVASQVGAQASVTHVDVAIITAVVLLWTEIGGAVGSAIAGAIWTNTMPEKLEKYLPNLSQAERDELFGSITDVTALPRGDPTREGVISGASPPRLTQLLTTEFVFLPTAYSDVMKIMVITATVISVVPIVLALFMPNWYLGDKQNAVDSADLTGERRADSDEPERPHA
ncbi:drug:h+ antiporter [Obba rivulosa]|uniref:Drug:h+ antiporter n=1 Tax=Obba rivulosa TaxID=1052685 RepID=A0A8E2AMK4_9APHY|nr:drug:h+ antiporter [Obba rivulosa]